MSRPFLLVDAFSAVPLAGNPCAVVLDADGLSDETMLRIAREMNQSETAFLFRDGDADFRARYFTPEREIPLAGHPTIASVHAAFETAWIEEKSRLTIRLSEGPIAVEIESFESRRWIRMFQRRPSFHAIHDPAVVMPLFGLRPEDVLDGAPVQTVSTGTKQLMIPVRSKDVLRRMNLNAAAYREYRGSSDFFSPHLFCLGGESADAATFARHPGLTMEDPFTGSSTGGMAAYLWKYGFLREPKFVAEQGHWLGRPGRARVEVTGLRDDIASVSVAGEAVTVARGTLEI